MVLAMDRNKLIGKDGSLPWYLPSELQYFKSVTMGKPLIMGRLTFESIGRPLPGRTSIVVTRNREWLRSASHENGKDWAAVGVQSAETIESALEQAKEIAQQNLSGKASPDQEVLETEVAIIGGASLCRDAMVHTDRLYLTVIDHEFEGDTWFDSYKPDEWKMVSADVQTVDGYKLEYRIMERES